MRTLCPQKKHQILLGVDKNLWQPKNNKRERVADSARSAESEIFLGDSLGSTNQRSTQMHEARLGLQIEHCM